MGRMSSFTDAHFITFNLYLQILDLLHLPILHLLNNLHLAHLVQLHLAHLVQLHLAHLVQLHLDSGRYLLLNFVVKMTTAHLTFLLVELMAPPSPTFNHLPHHLHYFDQNHYYIPLVQLQTNLNCLSFHW